MKSKGEILAAILNNYTECYLFLHNTKDEPVAVTIMEEGFLFENQLPHSTDLVNPLDPVEVTYFLLQRREYGPFTIVIAIDRILFDQLTSLALENKINIEDLLSIDQPYYGENEELIYRISNRYILGYFNNITTDFQQNPAWNPSYVTQKSYFN
jgi:hypothetical protein